MKQANKTKNAKQKYYEDLKKDGYTSLHIFIPKTIRNQLQKTADEEGVTLAGLVRGIVCGGKQYRVLRKKPPI